MSSTPTPPRGELVAALVELARREVGVAVSFDPALHLVEDLGLDSLRLMALAVAVEDRFRICLDAADEAEIATLGDLLAVIERKLGERADG